MPIGKLEVFDVETDNWVLYVERLEQYFLVNDVKLDLRVPTLITVMGSACYELLVTLCTPKKPSTLSFDEIVKILQCHLQPRPNILAERFKFRQRKQLKGENIAAFVAELKKLTKFCDFGNELDNNLRDQLVCGLVNDVIRQRLFEGEVPTFSKALQLAVAMEAAESDAAMLEPRGRDSGQSCRDVRDSVQGMAATHYVAAAGRGSKRSGGHNTRPAEQYLRRDTADTPAAIQQGGRGGRLAQAASGRAQSAASVCSVCGASHNTSTCRFRRYTCRVCNQEGHLKKMCPRLDKRMDIKWTQIQEQWEESSCSDNDCDDSLEQVNCNVFQLDSGEKYKPYNIDVEVGEQKIRMEIDTGSRISCVSYEFYRKKLGMIPLITSNLVMNYYTGEKVYPRGKIKPYVRYGDTCKQLDLFVIDNGKEPIMGREWLCELQIRLQVIDELNGQCSHYMINTKVFDMKELYYRYADVLSDGLGCFTGGEVSLHVRPDARPIFLRARPLAYALRERVEQALGQLERDGIITPVETSDWATPVVPVIKKDGSLRLCGDYKLTLNKCLEVDRFPLPRIDDLLTKLHSGQKYSKIDLSQAYAQFCLDERSKLYTVINTHRGLFKYNRLIYGLSSSPGIFQRKIEQIFEDMPMVGIFLDDVILTGRNDAEHLDTLFKVFDRLQRYGLKVKKEKCTFFADEVTYLGFIISKDGVKTCPGKVEAIQKVPMPSNVSELRSFLGMVMYYAKFVKNISMLLTPLYELIRKNSKFVWTKDCTEVFNRVKNLLSSSEVLAHYDSRMPVTLTTDASAQGVGAVIAHVWPDGTERPIAYASRVLNASEANYSQIQREALAIIFGVKKFHQYLYGREFILKTDHKPLVSIFGDKAGIPTMAASRLQRWAVILSGYQYQIQYVPTDKNGADALSRLPVGKKVKEQQEVTYINFVQDFLPITSEDVSKEVNSDRVLRKVIIFIRSGWPNTCLDSELQAYFVRRNELYVDAGCVMWGYRVVIPTELRTSILKELHVSHMGIVKMKSLARSYVWWPGIDADIERVCRECRTCRLEAPSPPKAPPQPWPYLSEPWSRLHVDFLGPFQGKTFFVIVDSSSKWIEAFEMKRTTGKEVLRVLRDVLARFGLPKELVSDNGPPFTSVDVAEFMRVNGIKHIFTPIYHPASNGAAENAVKICKKALKKALRDGIELDTALKSYLFMYRNTVHCTTGETPAKLLQHRALRSRLDLLNIGKTAVQGVKQRVEQAQHRVVEGAGGIMRTLNVGDDVWARGFGGEDKWVVGKIERKLGSRYYLVAKENGPPVKRHIDQLWKKSPRSMLACPLPADVGQPGMGGQGVSSPSRTPPPAAAETRSKRVRKPVVRYPL